MRRFHIRPQGLELTEESLGEHHIEVCRACARAHASIARTLTRAQVSYRCHELAALYISQVPDPGPHFAA